MEIRFEAMLYCNLGNAGHTKCSRGPQVPHPSFRAYSNLFDMKLHELVKLCVAV